MGNYGEEIQAAYVTQVHAEKAAQGMTQKALAAAAQIPTSTLSRYLSGERDIPMPEVIRLASALGLSFIELAERAQRRLEGKNVQ